MNILCTTTGVTSAWTLAEILAEINCDRSDCWTPYDHSDWLDGWMEWVECAGFYTLKDTQQ